MSIYNYLFVYRHGGLVQAIYTRPRRTKKRPHADLASAESVNPTKIAGATFTAQILSFVKLINDNHHLSHSYANHPRPRYARCARVMIQVGHHGSVDAH